MYYISVSDGSTWRGAVWDVAMLGDDMLVGAALIWAGGCAVSGYETGWSGGGGKSDRGGGGEGDEGGGGAEWDGGGPMS